MTAASAAPRKAPAKKRPTAPPAAVLAAAAEAQENEARASVVLDPDEAPAPVDMFPIFAIGDTQYYAPTRPAATVELTYLYLLRHKGEEHANGFLLEELVGHDGYVALMNYPALKSEHLERIFTALQEAVRGAAMGPGPKGGLRTI